EAMTALAQARAIDSNATWVHVHEALIQSAAGVMQPAAAAAAALVDEGKLKALPAWVGPMLELVRQNAAGDRDQLSASIARLREGIRTRRLLGVGVEYMTALTVPMLARTDHLASALDLMIDAANADAPPASDMLIMNPSLKGLLDDPRAQDVFVRSRAKFDVLLRAVDDARSAGRFPHYLEQPLQEIRSAIQRSPRARPAAD